MGLLRWGRLAGTSAVVFLALGGLEWRPEAVYGGRPLGHWVEALAAPDYRDRARAERVLQALGPEALPTLTRGLGMRDSRWAAFVRDLLPRALSPPNRRVAAARLREQSARLLGRLGPAAAPAGPSLTRALGDDDREVVRAAQFALRRVGPGAVPALLRGLDAGRASERQHAVELLGAPDDFGPAARTAVPRLAQLLQDADPGVRAQAAASLGGLRPPDEYVLRSLERSLADRLEAVRLASVQALGELGPAARRSVPAIVNILEISAPGVQVEAARALWRIEGTTANALPILLTALGNPQAHWQAALVLAEIGPPAQAAIPALVAALELEEVHRPSRTPASAALALARMGPAAVPKLAALLEHPRAAVRIGAAFALAGQGAAAERAVPGLLAMLDEDDGEARTAATNTLGAIGPGARAALPRLRLVARDPDEYLRAMAVAAIARISGAVPGASAADVN